MVVRNNLATRREFLRLGGVAGASLLFGAACADETNTAVTASADSAADGSSSEDAFSDTGADTAEEVVEDTTADAPADTTPPPYEEPAAGWPACDATATTQTITFVHVNDTHGNFAPLKDGKSPAARARGYFDKVKRENPFSLFTNGGDDFEKGSVAELRSSGQATLEYIEAMDFDVRCIGNHDFAWSPETLLDFTRAGSAKVLCSNVTYTGPDPSRWGALDFAKVDVGCLTVGFFSLVSKPWNERNEQYTGDFFPTDFPARWDWTERAQEIVAAHRAEVDLLVCISHLGNGGDQELAAAVDGLDVILGAHSHTVLMREELVNNTIIIQCGSSLGWVGRLDLDVDLLSRAITAHRYRMTPNLPGSLPENPRVAQAMTEMLERHAPAAHTTIARCTTPLSAIDIADLTSRAAIEIAGVDAAMTDATTVWSTWGAQGITEQDLADTYRVERQPAGTPGFNGFYTASLTGAALEQMRQSATDRWRFAGPASIDPAATYTVAVQKILVFNADVYLQPGVTFDSPDFFLEAWELLERFGQARAAAGLTFNDR